MLRSVPMKPLADCPKATLAAIRGLLTDIDETVSSEGHLTAQAYGAMEALKTAGLLVIPAGTQILRLLPPLNLSRNEAEAGLRIFETVVGRLAGS